MTLIITALDTYDCYAECLKKQYMLSVVMLNVVMPSVMAPK